MTASIEALATSVARLRGIVGSLDPVRLTDQAYPTEWTIADVLSHLGSGAEIFGRWLEDGLADIETPDDAVPAIWSTWNAKSPAEKAADCLVADGRLLERLEAVTESERAGFHRSLGPTELDFPTLAGMRLNEHALHTWDIEVVTDPKAIVAPEVTGVVVDRLGLTVRWTGRPTGTPHRVTVRTQAPRRDFVLVCSVEAVELVPGEPVEAPELDLPAEAFIRLVYGRLDPDHTPPVSGGADLDALRRTFPGP